MHNIASSVALSRVLKTGETLRDRLEAESRMDGEKDDQLIYPSIPNVFLPLLDTANSLDNYSYQEIKAYTEITGVKLDLFDIDILKEMDSVRKAAISGAKVEKIMEHY